ncbi:spermatogenesis-associated protein 22 [Anolis sagrei]|uniref:spermatogenesis-associated protein 22 n=1 Tax=Anolis sagrei TaxID=38937 RepID=UPI0035220DD7
MKRTFPENSSRTTAGCLPVPLFNQRKRSRQPLTSNPLQNEPGSNNNADNFDFSAMLADFGWESTKPEPTPLQKTARCENAPKSSASQAGRNWRPEENSSSANIWKWSDFSPAFGRGTESRQSSWSETRSDCWKGSGPKQLKLAGNPKALPQSSNKAGTVAKSGLSASSVPRGASYSFKPNPCRQEANEKTDKPMLPHDNTVQKGPGPHAKLKEKGNSLRILSAVIESMKHWSQFAEKTPLLFEVLGVLDSAVTPGPYGAKNFLLRDGKESVPCVFYEIDRDLPRLIRGRVHRCMGNYDTKKKLLRCVSVRPATADEEHTFQDFVRAADLEMGKYEKMSREV